MRARRGVVDDRLLCAGPGRLTQALGLSGADDGADLSQSPFALRPPPTPSVVERTPRIGITRAVEQPWRYVEAGSSWSSRRRRAA
jgi:DNA-3-methyladenine glycosylase